MKLVKKCLYPLIFALLVAAFVCQPKLFCQAFLQGLYLWASNVLPVLFPFCLLAPLACRFLPQRGLVTRFLFGQNVDGIFFTSLICGYPVGAKLIADRNFSAKQSIALTSFCSTAGPIFLLATVCPLLDNVVASAILVVTQTAACLLNGLIFRSYRDEQTDNVRYRNKDKNFSELLTDAVLSMLSVGALIALAYMFSAALKSVLPQAIDGIFVAFICGILEMTSGVFAISAATCDITAKTVLFSTLIGFGGVGVLLQSMCFLSKNNVKTTDYLKTKLTQSSLCAIISYLLCKFFL